jgi:hypothetical protein
MAGTFGRAKWAGNEVSHLYKWYTFVVLRAVFCGNRIKLFFHGKPAKPAVHLPTWQYMATGGKT